jgi:hypothetical protein
MGTDFLLGGGDFPKTYFLLLMYTIPTTTSRPTTPNPISPFERWMIISGTPVLKKTGSNPMIKDTPAMIAKTLNARPIRLLMPSASLRGERNLTGSVSIYDSKGK